MDTQIDVVGSQVILKIDRGVICDLEDSHASNTNVGALFRLERLVGDLIPKALFYLNMSSNLLTDDIISKVSIFYF